MTKTKSTKRALLLSALSLLMCVSMLIGSTFAWFTDSVTSAGNKIVAGALDVQLLMDADRDGTYDDISNSASPIFGEGSIAQDDNAETLWEPGKTQVAYLAIKNNGNLDLKYTVGLNVQDVSKRLYEVMEYAIVADAGKDTPVTSWTSGKSVVVGTQSVSGDVELKAGATHYFALAIHMDEQAGNEYQGGEVNFDLTVLATQLASESDSFDNQYDKNAGYDQGKTNIGPYKLNVLAGGISTYDTETKTYTNVINTVAQGGWNETQGNYYAGYTVNVAGYGEGATVKFNEADGTEVTWKLADEERDGFIKNGVHQQWTAVGLSSAYRYDIDGDGVTDFTVVNDASAAKVEVADAEQLKKVIEEEKVSAILVADIKMDVAATGFTVAKGTDVTIDLNGHDIVATSDVANASVQLFSVNGTLDIVGNGTISFTGDNFAWSEAYRYCAINIREAGVVTLGEGVEVVCEASKDGRYGMSYAVDIYTTGTLNVNGASLHSNYIAVRCFFGNSVVNVSSGSITSSRNNWGIWPQSSPDAVITIADGIHYTTDEHGIYIFN